MTKFVDAIHPAVSMTAGFFLILLLQMLDGISLHVATLFVASVAMILSLRALCRVLRRMRYVFLAICVLFVWQTPGQLVWPVFGVLSPTVEGLAFALEQISRLLGTVSVVALLLHGFDPTAWVQAFQVLTAPVRVLGLSTERSIVRLKLVLDEAADLRFDWRSVLVELPVGSGPQIVVWEQRPMRVRDICLMVVLLLLALGVGWWRG